MARVNKLSHHLGYFTQLGEGRIVAQIKKLDEQLLQLGKIDTAKSLRLRRDVLDSMDEYFFKVKKRNPEILGELHRAHVTQLLKNLTITLDSLIPIMRKNAEKLDDFEYRRMRGKLDVTLKPVYELAKRRRKHHA